MSAASVAPTLDPPVKELPDFRTTSDIIWGQWSAQAGENRALLKYVVMAAVSNVESRNIIWRALDTAKTELKTWLGTNFAMNSDAGKALLGVYLSCPTLSFLFT